MTDIEKLIEDLRGLLKQYGEKIPYGELVGAPWPYSRAGDLVWQDPEPYFIEQAATALSTLQAENEKLREKLEQVKRMFPGCAKCEYEDDGEPMRIYYPDGWDNGIGFEYGKAIFCPECGKPLTDEAVDMVMERLEALHETT